MTDQLSTSDRLDLAELVATYAAAVDERDTARLAALFVPDAVLLTADPPRSLAPGLAAVGTEAILASVQQLSAYVRTFHHLTGSVWSAEGPQAAIGRTTAVAHHVEGGAELRSWAWHVIYADRAVRSGSGWRFARRELTVAMIEARPIARVLPFDVPDLS